MVPCRKCEKCLQYRQMKWRERAITEVTRAKRTWWLTLTFAPTHLAGILMAAKGTSTKEVEAAAFPHVQRYIKRLRKSFHQKRDRILDAGGKEIGCHKAIIRYLTIFELGEKTGRQHYHLFIHEIGTRPVTKQQLEDTWRSNVHARLVSGDEASWRASYLTKYATKHFDIRPRASTGYGKQQSSE